MLIDLVIMIVTPSDQSQGADAPLVADWKGNTLRPRGVPERSRLCDDAMQRSRWNLCSRGSKECCSVLQNCGPDDWNCRISRRVKA